jgi:histidinol-phosphate/aromatic aminotransferase/cobyric acid decarboxylase-like protein
MNKESEHIKHLKEFRERAVAERRRLAEALSAKKGSTVKARDDFVTVQGMIEAVDRALNDEAAVTIRDAVRS